jgi:hypothetical protein
MSSHNFQTIVFRRFGFPNKQALDEGKTGVDCRGEEHDIVIIWSITSGKRQVYFDGNEVHFSTSRAGIFQYSWSARGNHVIKVSRVGFLIKGPVGLLIIRAHHFYWKCYCRLLRTLPLLFRQPLALDSMIFILMGNRFSLCQKHSN